MHSFKGGCSVTLSILGVPLADITRHVAWKSNGQGFGSYQPADILAAATAPLRDKCPPALSSGRAFIVPATTWMVL